MISEGAAASPTAMASVTPVSTNNISDANFPVFAGGNNDGGCNILDVGSCLRFCDTDFFINRIVGDESDLSFGSQHPGGAQFLLADGSVRLISENIDVEMYRRLGARKDGLPVTVP